MYRNGVRLCEYCRSVLSPREGVCPNCGAPVLKRPDESRPNRVEPPKPAQPKEPQTRSSGLILAILALTVCWVPLLGVVLSFIAILVSQHALRKGTREAKGRAVAALVLSIVTFITGIIFTVVLLTSG